MAILDDYLACAREVADWNTVESRVDITVFHQAFASPTETIAALRDFEIVCLMRDRTPLSAQTLAHLPNLRFITFTGRNNATLDIAAAVARGITVSYTERQVVESTTELIWALIMSVVRQLPANDSALRAGHWQHTVGMTLIGKTLGVVGLGRIGTPIARFGRAFGMDVVAWSPRLTDDGAAAVGARRVDFDALLASSDVVTLHVALNDGTRGLIGARELELMRPGAYLINTSRGPIVDQEALIEALHKGTIAGAGLDVYDQEPLPAGHPLISAPNTVLLPHLGFVTRETMTMFYEDSAENVEAWLDGTPIRVI
jgi:phosphoglycerate dehydrogenase-like enzyme